MARRREASTAAAEEIASACHAVRLRMLNRVISGIYDDALRPVGLKASQLNVLVAIAVTSSAQPGRVARALHMEKSTMSRNVDKMRAQGWVRSRESSSGGQLLILTASGHRLLNEALPLWRKAQAEAERRLGREGVDAVRALHGSVSAQ